MEVIVNKYGEKRTIWIGKAVLTAAGVDKEAIRIGSYRHSRKLTTSWKSMELNGQTYYDYSTIPSATRIMLPTEETLLNTFRSKGVSDFGAYLNGHLAAESVKTLGSEKYYEIFSWYMYAAPVRFSSDQARDLAEGYAVAQYVKAARKDGTFRRWGFAKIIDFDNAFVEYLKTRKYPNFRPSSPRALRAKLETINIPADMISGNYGNSNADKVKKTTVCDTSTGEILDFSLDELVMYGLWNGLGAEYGELSKKSKILLYQQYKDEMTRYGFGANTMAYRTFCYHTDKWETKMFASFGRDGATLHNNSYRPFTMTQGVLHPMSLWVADGTGTKMVFQYKGQMKTLYRVNIFDVHSQKIVGYSIQDKIGYHVDKEEAWMFRDALKMAVETCGGRVANELLSDNGGAFSKAETKEICNLLFPIYRTINPGNSQENQAETLQRIVFNFCRRYPNFVGSRMGNRSDQNRTTNFEGLDISKLPTFEEAVRQQIEMVKAWNSEKGADGLSPDERFFGTDKENLTRSDWGVKPSAEALRRAFGMTTQMHLGWMRGKLRIKTAAGEYAYEIDLEKNAHEINRKTGYKGDAEVLIFHDGSVADLYTLDGRLICSCNAVEKAFKALCEADEATGRGMASQMEIRQRFDRKVAANTGLLDEMRFRLPLTGEITDYGFAVAGKSSVKYEIQDEEEILLNEELENALECGLPARPSRGQDVRTPSERAFDDF